MIQTLMSVDGNGKGNFADWLKKLGLSDGFLRDYPIAQLVDWGWLRPQFRVIFPPAFFDRPETLTWPSASSKVTTALEEVWLHEWHFNNEQEPRWFLHPFFRPDTKAYTLLEQNSAASGLPARPLPFTHTDGRSISPFEDYYFPWQAFALIDVIRSADIFSQTQHFLNSPDAQQRAQSLLCLADTVSWNPQRTLDSQQSWAAWAEPLIWLAHYEALDDFVKQQGLNGEDCLMRRRRGANQLATHLGIDAAKLEAAVKEKLLVLADRWLSAAEKNDRWVTTAYPFLQKEIYLAVHWLCMLTGNKLDDYFEKWRNTSRQNEGWAELHAVLPFEYYGNRKKFIELAPYYLQPFNERLPLKYRIEGERFVEIVDVIRINNPHFNSFVDAFSTLHQKLTPDRSSAGKLDFSERRPLDYYLLLAIRAESCFRFALNANNTPSREDSLENYLTRLAQRVGLNTEATGRFTSNRLTMTQLHGTPSDFIEGISALVTGNVCSQAPLGQAMLCCLVARNYFAHHDYHDEKLLNHESSHFLMGGILLAVLILLKDETPQPSCTTGSQP